MSGLTKPGPSRHCQLRLPAAWLTHRRPPGEPTRLFSKALKREEDPPPTHTHISSRFQKENSVASGQSCGEHSYRSVCDHSPSLHTSIPYHPHASFTSPFIISYFPTLFNQHVKHWDLIFPKVKPREAWRSAPWGLTDTLRDRWHSELAGAHERDERLGVGLVTGVWRWWAVWGKREREREEVKRDTISFNLHKMLFPLYRWGNRSLERKSELWLRSSKWDL